MDERIWTDRPLAVGTTIELPGCRVTRVEVGCQSLLSGDLQAGLDILAPDAEMLGFADTPGTADHAIRIARDQALLVTAKPMESQPGWHPQGFALSPAGGRYACLSLIGPNAAELLAHGLTSAPPWDSPSAAVNFAGVPALVTGTSNGLTLWVESAYLTYVTSFMAQIAEGQTHARSYAETFE
ncbi:MAG: hypothetical protein QNJ09_13725 [Paracoccaceae bacterium]|nr:hypothetical protein [Paracoccaceae bacterium]